VAKKFSPSNVQKGEEKLCGPFLIIPFWKYMRPFILLNWVVAPLLEEKCELSSLEEEGNPTAFLFKSFGWVVLQIILLSGVKDMI